MWKVILAMTWEEQVRAGMPQEPGQCSKVGWWCPMVGNLHQERPPCFAMLVLEPEARRPGSS